MIDWNVGEILKTSNGYWRGCALQSAVSLDVFTLLGEKQLSVEEVTQETDTDFRGMEYLLNALAAMGLLVKKEGKYSNTDVSGRLLHAESPDNLNHIILHHKNILNGWSQLDKAVTIGKPVKGTSLNGEQERENFLMGMFNLAKSSAPLIAQKIDLSSYSNLLDLGGGPGTYAIYFCLAHDKLQATILDRPTSEPFAQKTVAQYNLSDRISFLGGDFNQDALPEKTFDVAWLSHVLHSNGPDACQHLIERVAKSLLPRGRIIIHDFFLNDEKDGPEFPALFALNMLVGTQDGRSYSEEETREMLTKSGFKMIERLDYQSPNNSSILSATL